MTAKAGTNANLLLFLMRIEQELSAMNNKHAIRYDQNDDPELDCSLFEIQCAIEHVRSAIEYLK